MMEIYYIVALVGFEPTRPKTRDFKSLMCYRFITERYVSDKGVEPLRIFSSGF